VETKRKLSFKEKEEFKNLENELTELELRKEQLSNELSTSVFTGEELVKKGEELGVVISLLEEKTDRWLILSEYI
ncbi:MAG: ABC transporter C-terminal domain-containing protein, partial [Crocinitomicaceae bacterium]